MIKLFRTIRHKLLNEYRFGEYLIYALGEIVLVVIGILIALQLNIMNEGRKRMKKEYAVMGNLIQDLRADSTSYIKNHQTLRDIKFLHKALYQIGVNGEKNILIEKPNYIRRTLYYNPITIEDNPLVSSQISSDEIRKEIVSYFRYAKNMDNSYGEFKEVIHNRMRLFLAEKEAHNVSNWFQNQNLEVVDIVSRENLIALAKLPEFQQLLFEASVKLSEVIESLEILINQNTQLKEVLKEELKRES